jgi:hypothetical protein
MADFGLREKRYFRPTENTHINTEILTHRSHMNTKHALIKIAVTYRKNAGRFSSNGPTYTGCPKKKYPL